MLADIVSAIVAAGGQPFIVGGWVRDQVLGLPSKDVDVEVFGLSMSELAAVLSTFGQVDMVGVSFGVLKLHGLDVDFSLPRRDSKVSAGHKGFDVETDPNMTPEQAAARRDFTINAMSWDMVNNTLTDPFNGKADIEAGILRHTSPAFAEDPLRVLRGMQFCGRFRLVADPDTLAMMHSLSAEFDTLATERVWGEWWKWATKSLIPSLGLDMLRECGWLCHFPAIEAMIGTPQQPEWHPEGDVWEHTLHAVNWAAEIAIRDNLLPDERGILVLAALCHDMGKPDITCTDEDGNIVSHGHAEISAIVAGYFLENIGAPSWVIERVTSLAGEHMAHVGATVTPRMVRRLSHRLHPSNVNEWARLVEADHSARPPLPIEVPMEVRRVVSMAQAFHIESNRPQPVLMGRHLLAHVEPGPHMGEVLRAAFEAQLDGEFDTPEGGIAWAHAAGWF